MTFPAITQSFQLNNIDWEPYSQNQSKYQTITDQEKKKLLGRKSKLNEY